MSSTPIEKVRIAYMAAGDLKVLAELQQTIRWQEAAGMIRVISMDDEIALMQWVDPIKAALFSSARAAP